MSLISIDILAEVKAVCKRGWTENYDGNPCFNRAEFAVKVASFEPLPLCRPCTEELVELVLDKADDLRAEVEDGPEETSS